jgi:hypothetical protein
VQTKTQAPPLCGPAVAPGGRLGGPPRRPRPLRAPFCPLRSPSPSPPGKWRSPHRVGPSHSARFARPKPRTVRRACCTKCEGEWHITARIGLVGAGTSRPSRGIPALKALQVFEIKITARNQPMYFKRPRVLASLGTGPDLVCGAPPDKESRIQHKHRGCVSNINPCY